MIRRIASFGPAVRGANRTTSSATPPGAITNGTGSHSRENSAEGAPASEAERIERSRAPSLRISKVSPAAPVSNTSPNRASVGSTCRTGGSVVPRGRISTAAIAQSTGWCRVASSVAVPVPESPRPSVTTPATSGSVPQ